MELERVEPEPGEPRRHRRALDAHARGGHALDVLAAARQAARLDHEIPHPPRARGRERAVLDHEPVAAHRGPADGHRTGAEGDVLRGHAQRGRRHDVRRATQLEPAEPRVHREPCAAAGVVGHAHGGVDDAALGSHRQAGRQVEADERRVHVAEDRHRLQLERREPEVADPEGHGRARHHRARGRDPGGTLPGARQVARLEGDAVGPPAPDGREPRVLQHQGAAVHREPPEGDAAGADAKVVHPDAHGGRGEIGAVLPGSLQLDAGEIRVERDAGAAGRVALDRPRRVDHPAGRARRAGGRQVEPEQRGIHLPRDGRRPEAQRAQPDVRHPERDGRARYDRAHRHDAGRRRGQGGHAPRLQREGLHAPGARRRERAVLDLDGASDEREALEREREPGSPAALAGEEIGDVERARPRPDDAERRRLEGAAREAQVAAEEIADAQPELEPRDRRQRALVPVEHAESVEGDAAVAEAHVDTGEGDRAARGRRDSPDHDPAGDPGQGQEPAHRQRDERDGRDDGETNRAASAHDDPAPPRREHTASAPDPARRHAAAGAASARGRRARGGAGIVSA